MKKEEFFEEVDLRLKVTMIMNDMKSTGFEKVEKIISLFR